MFKPKFNYTTGMVNDLVAAGSAAGAVSSIYLTPRWEATLRKEAHYQATHASTALDGNTLSLEEVSLLARGKEISVGHKARQEVFNYLRVLENISDHLENNLISEGTVSSLHREICRDTLQHPSSQGVYRSVQVELSNSATGEVLFRPPAPGQVPREMVSLLRWLNSEGAAGLHPVLVAGIAHYEFLRIHPFVVGNGRVARALVTLILNIRHFEATTFLVLDEFYNSHRNSYFQHLWSVNQISQDLTNWLEYFVEGVVESLTELETRLSGLPVERKLEKLKPRRPLTERQKGVVEHILEKGWITSSELGQTLGISRQAALKELNKLVGLKLIELVGEKRGAHYILTG